MRLVALTYRDSNEVFWVNPQLIALVREGRGNAGKADIYFIGELDSEDPVECEESIAYVVNWMMRGQRHE